MNFAGFEKLTERIFIAIDVKAEHRSARMAGRTEQNTLLLISVNADRAEKERLQEHFLRTQNSRRVIRNK